MLRIYSTVIDTPVTDPTVMNRSYHEPTPRGPSAAVQQPNQEEATQTELLLHTVRRLDWRFLLPTPSLTQVAYLGASDSTLAAALAHFATELTHVTGAAAEQQGTQKLGQYDVVVAVNPTPQQIKLAARLMKPGGSLYIEGYGIATIGKQLLRGRGWRKQQLWQPAAYVKALQRLGLTQVDLFWFWPNHERCTKIIPLDESVALAQAFALYRQSHGLQERLAAQGQKWFLRSGFLTYVVPSYSVVAR